MGLKKVGLTMRTVMEKVLDLDIEHLTLEEMKWLHDLKNKAAVLQGRLELKEKERS